MKQFFKNIEFTQFKNYVDTILDFFDHPNFIGPFYLVALIR